MPSIVTPGLTCGAVKRAGFTLWSSTSGGDGRGAQELPEVRNRERHGPALGAVDQPLLDEPVTGRAQRLRTSAEGLGDLRGRHRAAAVTVGADPQLGHCAHV